jgi:hypothetical protein
VGAPLRLLLRCVGSGKAAKEISIESGRFSMEKKTWGYWILKIQIFFIEFELGQI